MEVSKYSPLMSSRNVFFGNRSKDKENSPVYSNSGKGTQNIKAITAALVLATLAGTSLCNTNKLDPIQESMTAVQRTETSENEPEENIELTEEEQELVDKITSFDYSVANLNKHAGEVTENVLKAIAQIAKERPEVLSVLSKQHIAILADDKTFDKIVKLEERYDTDTEDKLKEEVGENFYKDYLYGLKYETGFCNDYGIKTDKYGTTVYDKHCNYEDGWTGELVFEARKQGIVNKKGAEIIIKHLTEINDGYLGNVVRTNPNPKLEFVTAEARHFHGYYLDEITKTPDGHISARYKKFQNIIVNRNGSEYEEERTFIETMKYLPDESGTPIDGTLEFEETEIKPEDTIFA